MLDTITSDDRDIAASQEIDPTIGVFQLNHITGFDGFVRQEDEPAHQVGKDFLQAETQPQPQSAAEQGEDGEIQTQIM